MRLYVKDKTGKKVYLDVEAETRSELYAKIGSFNFIVQRENYRIIDVLAETGGSDFTGGATVGAGIGLIIAGPIGAFIGGTVGGIIGGNRDGEELEKVKRFNESDPFPPNSADNEIFGALNKIRNSIANMNF